MIVVIPNVLEPAEVAGLRKKIDAGKFVDGMATTGRFGKGIKNNQQLDNGPTTVEIQKAIIQKVTTNKLFDMAARPLKVRPPMIARYGPGMSYGPHVDNALMPGNPPMRSDLSFTLFLEDPDKYEGGELVIADPLGDKKVKLPAGGLVLYPTSSLHYVAPVTKGQRLVVVCWVQSQVRDPKQREILFEMTTVLNSLFERDGQSDEFNLLLKTTNNLLRMWVEV